MDQASATARLGDALLVVDLQSCFRRLHLRLVRARPDLDGPRRCRTQLVGQLGHRLLRGQAADRNSRDDRILRYVVTGHGVRDAVQRADDYQQGTRDDSHHDARVPPPGRLPRRGRCDNPRVVVLGRLGAHQRTLRCYRVKVRAPIGRQRASGRRFSTGADNSPKTMV